MWDDEYEIYLRDMGALAKQNFEPGAIMNEAQLHDTMVELKKIVVLLAMILVVLICFFILMIFK
jgi:hypothetical protein